MTKPWGKPWWRASGNALDYVNASDVVRLRDDADDLLDAVRELTDVLETLAEGGEDDPAAPFLERARAAIAKAERQP